MTRSSLDHPVTTPRGLSSRLRALLRIPTPLIFGASVLLALVILWYQGVLQDTWRALGDANLADLLLAAPIYVASLGLLCYRWHLLVRMAQGSSNFPRASEAFLTSVVINYAAPIGLAVPSRAALTKRALGLDAHATGTIAIWEIGMDVIILGIGSLLWLTIAEGSLREVRGGIADALPLYLAAFAIALVIVIAVAIWAYRKPGMRSRIGGAARRILLAPAKRPTEALFGLLTTAGYWIIQGIVIDLLLRALHVQTSFELILGMTSLPILIGMLSPIPGGAVVREALMYAVARLADAPGDQVLAAAVIYRVALFVAIPILYGIVRFWIRHSPSHRPEASSGSAAPST